jgi:predicted O-linked N-acetylglucosamine transferase (SPINDLY family)
VQTQRLESPLFNMTVYTRDMERLLTRIWQRHEAGKQPDHITEWNDE